jgi:hypothetical protein
MHMLHLCHRGSPKRTLAMTASIRDVRTRTQMVVLMPSTKVKHKHVLSTLLITPRYLITKQAIY